MVALLLGANLAAALAVWGYTITGAVAVNRLRGHPLQTFVAGLLLATGLVGVSLWPGLSPFLAAVSALFLLKVLFSFAVDHYRTATPEAV